MHEVGLVSDALKRAIETAEQSGAGRIERVTFAVRPDGHATPEIVTTLFGSLSTGTIAEGALVEIERLDASMLCFACGTVFTTTSEDATCPDCGSPGVATDDTPDLTLVSIDVAD